MKVDGVFSGGGVRAYAFLGALEEVEKRGIKFERTAGTSAGSLLASLVAAGYHSHEIKEILHEMPLESFLQEPILVQYLPFIKWISLYFKLGLYRGDKMEQWIEGVLARKGVKTFEDLKPGYLKIVVSDISLGRIVVIPDDLPRFYNIDGDTFPVARAVRISSTIPYFFMPYNLKTGPQERSLLVDGGLLSNFPIWLFLNDEKKKRPILGMKLSSSADRMPERKIDNAIDMFQALFSTMKNAHDARHISKATAEEVMFIPVEKVEATDFDISEREKIQLMEIGRERAIKFLKKWSY
ncbi:MAG: patatin-like phospholipase family protein [Bacillaceae bacterium]|nr:patatin-like phospholipase family protein [Bacillaceae bacterium]